MNIHASADSVKKHIQINIIVLQPTLDRLVTVNNGLMWMSVALILYTHDIGSHPAVT